MPTKKIPPAPAPAPAAKRAPLPRLDTSPKVTNIKALPLAQQRPLITRTSEDQFSRMAAAIGSAATDSRLPPADISLETILQSDGRTTSKVPLRDIRTSEWNARVRYSAEEIDATGASLEADGQELPAKGYLEDGKVVLIDGGKRLRAARSRGLDFLDVIVVEKPESPAEIYLASRRINKERSEHTALDDATQWAKLLEAKLFADQSQLAKQLGVSNSTVTQTLSINRIPDKLIQRMKEHRALCTLYMASAIAGLFAGDPPSEEAERATEEFAGEIIDAVTNKGLGYRQVAKLIERHGKPKSSRPRAEAHPIAFAGVKGMLKVQPVKGRVDFSITGLNAEKLQQLRSALAPIFNSAEA